MYMVVVGVATKEAALGLRLGDGWLAVAGTEWTVVALGGGGSEERIGAGEEDCEHMEK